MFGDKVDMAAHRALQQRIHRLEGLVGELCRRVGLDDDLVLKQGYGVSDRVVELARGGAAIRAIKAAREETGLGLAEAKTLVERIQADQG